MWKSLSKCIKIFHNRFFFFLFLKKKSSKIWKEKKKKNTRQRIENSKWKRFEIKNVENKFVAHVKQNKKKKIPKDVWRSEQTRERRRRKNEIEKRIDTLKSFRDAHWVFHTRSGYECIVRQICLKHKFHSADSQFWAR